MSVQVGWLVNVQVGGGPRLPAAGTLDVDAYDMVKVEVASGADAMEVSLQPSTGDEVKLLMLHASSFSEDLTYSINASEADVAKRFALDGPHLLVGSGALALLGDPPQRLFLYNGGIDAAQLSVLVGRDATP